MKTVDLRHGDFYSIGISVTGLTCATLALRSVSLYVSHCFAYLPLISVINVLIMTNGVTSLHPFLLLIVITLWSMIDRSIHFKDFIFIFLTPRGEILLVREI